MDSVVDDPGHVHDVEAAFRRRVGRWPAGVWSAPGRANLIGEHTDYNDGWVLPIALQVRTAVAVAPRDDGVLLVSSVQRPGDTVAVPIGDVVPGAVVGWAAYIAGAAWALRDAGHQLGGADIVVDGRVPPGAGLASSAAIGCAAVVALADLHDIRLTPIELARTAQRAENDFAGVPCGLMDQAVSILGRRDHALFLDTREGAYEHVAFDLDMAGLTLLVLDTHIRHAHAGGMYAQRRRECATATALLGVASLRDISGDRLDEALAVLAHVPALARRVRHVVTENERTVTAAALLREGRLAAIAPLLSASHTSLRDDFEVSAPAVDTVVDTAVAAGALGARMTGGGFGGCVIALVASARSATVVERVMRECAQRGVALPTAVAAVVSTGARRDTPSPR